MPLVTISGWWRNHGLAAVGASARPRLWLVPNKGHVKSGYALDGTEFEAELSNDGSFTVQVWSEPGDSDLYYTLVSDWLPPGQEAEAPGKRALGRYEWPQRIFPDVGGDIGDLVDLITGIGLVYVDQAVKLGMSPVPRYQLAYNPVTNDLYERVIEW